MNLLLQVCNAEFLILQRVSPFFPSKFLSLAICLSLLSSQAFLLSIFDFSSSHSFLPRNSSLDFRFSKGFLVLSRWAEAWLQICIWFWQPNAILVQETKLICNQEISWSIVEETSFVSILKKLELYFPLWAYTKFANLWKFRLFLQFVN